MNSTYVKAALIVCAVAAIGTALALLIPLPQSTSLLTDPSTDLHTITLTQDGFNPNQLVIRQGDTVTFATDLDTPFWPASNLHPNHTIYPDFDSKEAVTPENTWSFTFVDAGRFSYHDHLFANYTGNIIVLSPEEEASGKEVVQSVVDIDSCSVLTEISEKQQCWDEQLQLVLNIQGMDAAFDYFIQLYNTEPDIPKECHGWGHTLGEAAYALYKDGNDLDLKPESSYCGYGFFHGFIGALITDTGQVQQTREFCEYVANELEGEMNGIRDNCIHGIGHGTTAMLLEEGGYAGEFFKTADKSTEICELIYDHPVDLENCYDGVFNELSLVLFQSNYGFDFESYFAEQDAFKYCHDLKEEYKLSCYYEMAGMLWRYFDHDVTAATAYALENTQDLVNRGPKVIARIAADQIQFDIVKPSKSNSVDACRTVPEFLWESCFEGILNGFIQHGEPGKFHETGYAFCRDMYLTDVEKTYCYDRFTRMIQWSYDAEAFSAICKSLQYEPEKERCIYYEENPEN